jgi:uncharacterized protein (UPF0548 family)
VVSRSPAERWRIPSRFPEFDFGGGAIKERLAALHGRPLNFDPATLDGPGWEHDSYRQPLPSEHPGPPEPGGSWDNAVALCRGYAFADPSLVEAHYDSTVPLGQREMLLILHALGARIYAGVRVGCAGTEERTDDGRQAHVDFWNYQTLEGHVEAGQRDFEVWKWRDTGEVEFRTHAISRPAETTSPVVKLGFRLLGRHKQVEFGRRACNRMALLTEAKLRQPDAFSQDTILDGRLLAIYLRDHHALLVALCELADRMSSASRPGEQHAFAVDVHQTAVADRVDLEALLDRLDSGPSLARHAAVWAGEKLGRLKLNGRVVRASPLSAVTELEGCLLLLESNRALWSGVASLAIGPADATDRAQLTSKLLATGERLRLNALHSATQRDVDATSDDRS